MSPLAEAVYAILRRLPGEPDPRLTYKELALQLRETAEAFEHINHRNPTLYTALGEVADECRRLRLPSLAALVVRADTRRPGEAYYVGMGLPHRGQRIAAWRQELEAVSRSIYPPRGEHG
jgi:hypothetical protein